MKKPLLLFDGHLGEFTVVLTPNNGYFGETKMAVSNFLYHNGHSIILKRLLSVEFD